MKQQEQQTDQGNGFLPTSLYPFIKGGLTITGLILIGTIMMKSISSGQSIGQLENFPLLLAMAGILIALSYFAFKNHSSLQYEPEENGNTESEEHPQKSPPSPSKQQKILPTILNHFDLPILVTSPDQERIDFVSASAQRILGKRRELKGKSVDHWLQWIHPDDHEQARQQFEQWDDTREQKTLSCRFVRPDGEIRPLNIRLVSLRDLSFSAEGYSILLQDRSQQSQKVSGPEQDGFYKHLFQSLPIAVWVTSAESGELVYLSPAIERILGVNPETILETPEKWIESIHPDDREHRNAGESLPLWNNDVPSDLYRIIRPDGEIRWVADRAFPIRDDSGEIYRFAGVLRDVTREVQLRKELELNDM